MLCHLPATCIESNLIQLYGKLTCRVYLDKLAHIQVVINCWYSVAQLCTNDDGLAYILGAPSIDDVMRYNLLTTHVYFLQYVPALRSNFLAFWFLFLTWQKFINWLLNKESVRITKLFNFFRSRERMSGSDLQFYLTWLKDQLKAQVN